MILQFPDLDTFRLVLTSGVVPPAVALAPVAVSFTPDGLPLAEPTAPPRNLAAGLKKFNVASVKAHAGKPETLSCWPQVLPLVVDPAEPVLGNQTPVLFELATGEQLPGMVGEMLRLGNDRQSFRWLVPATGDGGARVLLRVVGPPYYSLLRATEAGQGVRAFIERAPRVWVELGKQHPLADQIKPAEGQMLLLSGDRTWAYLETAPYQDVYEVLDFPLPGEPVEWAERPFEGSMKVPLRLAAGNAAEVPELWVLRRDAVDQLDTLVRDADEKLMSRLSFAVAREGEGPPTIILRVRPSKLPPPTLELSDALGFKPFWKLPNLFLPVGTRLMPTLRRDRVRQLLADDPARVVWLYPEAGRVGPFTPESLGDEAFRPLDEWVDYVIDHEREPLSAWVNAMKFEFETFVCPEEHADQPKSPPDRGKPPRRRDGGDRGETSAPAEEEAAPRRTGRRNPRSEPQAFTEVVQTTPSELRQRREELERAFFAVEGGMDAPERGALWPDLARVNAALGEHHEAALCWASGFWEEHAAPDAGYLAEWLRAENAHATIPVTAEELDRLLARETPSAADLRQFAATLLVALSGTVAPEVSARLPRLAAYLEAHEARMSVRQVWLSWTAVTAATHDVLALARVRDRLLTRLLEEGMNQERDIPTFIRFAGLRDSERARLVHDHIEELQKRALAWNGDDAAANMRTNRSYIDLIFAFGMARLGEATQAKLVMTRAVEVLSALRDQTGGRDEVHRFMAEAFKFRIDQALAGRAPSGTLPPELMARLGGMASMVRYGIDRMLERSRVLEPAEKFDPYRLFARTSDQLVGLAAELPEHRDPAVLRQRVGTLMQQGIKGDQAPTLKMYLLTQMLPVAPRVGEELTSTVLALVPDVLGLAPRPGEQQVVERQCNLLERGMTIAALYDRTDMVTELTGRFTKMLREKTPADRYEMINRVAGECLRGLRRLSLREVSGQLLEEMSTLVVAGRPLAAVLAADAANRHKILQTMLYIASGRLSLNPADPGVEPTLEEARAALFEPPANPAQRMQPLDLTKLARAYIAALAQLPAEQALGRFDEMFRRLPGLPNTFTTSTHYSRLHLDIVEDTVRAVVSDEFTLGPSARKWTDEDEYLVRRRIHRDLRVRMLGGV